MFLVTLHKDTRSAVCPCGSRPLWTQYQLLCVYLSDAWVPVSHSSVSCMSDRSIHPVFVAHSDMPGLKGVRNKTNQQGSPRQPLVAVSSDRIYESWLGPNPCLENN